jgi:dolichol-phosphate mannosyltransferase
LIILPTFNEVENLETVYRRIRSLIQCDILIIDDGSVDGTIGVIKKLQKEDSAVLPLLRNTKSGLGKTYLTGYEYAIKQEYDALIQLDADGSHEIEKIPIMIDLYLNGTKMLVGSRYVPGGDVSGWSKTRVMISRIGNAYGRFILGLDQKDVTSGFRLYDVKTLALLDLSEVEAKGYSFQIQMSYVFRNVKSLEVPIIFVDRVFGESKMGYKIVLEALYQIPRIRIRDMIGRVLNKIHKSGKDYD